MVVEHGGGLWDAIGIGGGGVVGIGGLRLVVVVVVVERMAVVGLDEVEVMQSKRGHQSLES